MATLAALATPFAQHALSTTGVQHRVLSAEAQQWVGWSLSEMTKDEARLLDVSAHAELAMREPLHLARIGKGVDFRIDPVSGDMRLCNHFDGGPSPIRLDIRRRMASMRLLAETQPGSAPAVALVEEEVAHLDAQAGLLDEGCRDLERMLSTSEQVDDSGAVAYRHVAGYRPAAAGRQVFRAGHMPRHLVNAFTRSIQRRMRELDRCRALCDEWMAKKQVGALRAAWVGLGFVEVAWMQRRYAQEHRGLQERLHGVWHVLEQRQVALAGWDAMRPCDLRDIFLRREP